MKYAGKQIQGPKTDIAVIPRNEGNLIFKAQAVLDYSDFEKLCPLPKPPKTKRPGQPEFEDVNHPDYLKAVDIWSEKRMHWMILKSLEPTDELEWETIDPSNAETWKNWRQELQDAGLNAVEISTIQRLTIDVNSIDSKKAEEARASFLASTAAKAEASLSQSSAQ